MGPIFIYRGSLSYIISLCNKVHKPQLEAANSINLSLTGKWHYRTLVDHFIKKNLGQFIMLTKYKLIEYNLYQ